MVPLSLEPLGIRKMFLTYFQLSQSGKISLTLLMRSLMSLLISTMWWLGQVLVLRMKLTPSSDSWRRLSMGTRSGMLFKDIWYRRILSLICL